MNKLIPDINYSEETYDVTFDENGNVEKIFLYVGYMSGFVVDLIDVTEAMNKTAKDFFEKKYQQYEEDGRQKNEDDDDGGPRAA